MVEKFNAMVVDMVDNQIVFAKKAVSLEDLSDGDVIIKVAYTSLNYKDMLAVQKGTGVIRQYPMIPGIDLSGTVVESTTDDFTVGQEVLVTGYEVGMSHTGGFAEYARVPKEWVVPLPEGLFTRCNGVWHCWINSSFISKRTRRWRDVLS